MLKKLASLVLAGLLALPLAAEQITLAKDSKATAVIVLPKSPHPKLTNAANDLQSYIKKICGVTLPIVKNGKKAAGCAIYIGDNELTAPGDKLSVTTDPDTIVKSVRNGSIFLNARTVTAASWAVYTFMQEDLGVRWFAPGEDWEYVPKAPKAGTLTLDVKSKTYKPTIAPRTWTGHFNTPQMKEWCTRQKVMVNDIRWKAAFANNIFRVFPPAKYAKDHPEYYPLINGKRHIPKANASKWRPCESNPEVQKILVEHIRNYFDSNDRANSFSLGLDDVFHLCECANCRAMDSSPDDMVKIKYSSRHYKFVNIIAREVAKTHPNKYIGTLIYSPTLQPPVDVPKMEDNVCAYITQDSAQWKNPATRKEAMQLTEEWSKRVKYLSRYEYIGLSCVTPRYYPHLLEEALRFDISKGFIGQYQETTTVLPTTAPMIWALSELQWDASRTMDSLLDEFMTKMFCECAPEMKEYYDFLEKCWSNNHLATWVYNDLEAQASVMKVEELRAAHKILDRALAKATSPMTRKRIQVTKDALTFGGYVIEEYNICKPWKTRKVTSKADALEAADQAVTLAKMAREREKFWADSMTADNIMGESLRGLNARRNLCITQITRIEQSLLIAAVDGMEFLRKNDPAEFARQYKRLEDVKGSIFVQTLLGALMSDELKSANLLPNGSFDRLNKDGVPAYWDTWGYMPATFKAELKGGRNGTHAGRHNRNVGVCYLHYRAVKPGEVYYVESWFKGTGGLATIAIQFSGRKGWKSRLDLEPRVSVPVNGQWQILRNSARVPEGATTMQVAFNGNAIPEGHHILVDDAVVQKVFSPEDFKAKASFINAPAPKAETTITVPSGKNLLRNSNFNIRAADPAKAPGWYTYGSPYGGLFKVAPKLGRGDSQAAMVYSTFGSFIQYRLVKPGEKYYIEAWSRSSNKADILLQVRYKNKGAWMNKKFNVVKRYPATYKWQKLAMQITVPENATEMHLMLTGHNLKTGEYVLFDDAVLKKMQ